MKQTFDEKTIHYLQLLARNYPSIQSVATEIINLRAIMNLPKGTEHFISDIHGEYEGFRHILRNASGSVRKKIDQALDDYVASSERRELAALIYYPKLKLNQLEAKRALSREWYTLTLKQLVAVCRITTSKYTASKVRRMLPPEFANIILELMTTGSKDFNKEEYYGQILDAIIDTDSADRFIIAICHLIQDSVIDMLHIVGDIYDRGESPHLVMDELMKQRNVDIQWGNHDILWMGAAVGNPCCIANAVRICLRYNNYDFLENGYGINMIPLTLLALDVYANDPCSCFIPKEDTESGYTEYNSELIAKMHKAIAMIQFKLEGQMAMQHPEYQMEDRLLLDRIDFANGVVRIGDREYPLKDRSFPTIDPESPYKLTVQEQEVIDALCSSFLNNEKLQRHIDFLYEKGSMYRYYNKTLMFHGCIPLEDDGSFMKVNIYGRHVKAKSYFDVCEELVREARFAQQSRIRKRGVDFMWYLWCGSKSPLFGKAKMATFERYFLEDKETHEEHSNPYFKLVNSAELVDQILGEFGIADPEAVIVNGHIPVKIKKGESPIKVPGRLVLIDGGMSKAYQPVTGIAGYTLVYNSHQMYLSEHEPFNSAKDTVRTNSDMESRVIPFKTFAQRIKVSDTDQGKEIAGQIADLEMLLKAYRNGSIKQRTE